MKKLLLIIITILFVCEKGHSQWTSLLSGYTNVIMQDITQTPSGTLFAVGTKIVGTNFIPIVFKSSNNGFSWDTTTVLPNGYVFQTIAFLSDSIGYIGVGGGAYLVQTIDGGNTWNYYYTNPSGTTINDIEVIDNNTAIACGFGSSMYSSGAAYTLTNQNNWNAISQSFPTTTLDDMQMINQDTGYVLSLYDKKLFKTSNGGNSWDLVYNFPTAAGIMYWWNSLNGIAVGFNASYYRTIDGGNHWTKDSITGYTSELTGVAFFDNNNGYACSEGGHLFRTTNGGQTWAIEPSVNTDDFYNMEIHGGNAYALGINGKIFRHQNPTGINELNPKMEVRLFPNPTNECVKINASDVFESIVITDVSGKIIFQNQNIKCKTYSIETKSYADGIYFLQISNKQNTSVQKLIVQH